MPPRKTVKMHPVHLRGHNGVTHAMRGLMSACGERSVLRCTVTTLDPIDCMTCLARGFECDIYTATIPFEVEP